MAIKKKGDELLKKYAKELEGLQDEVRHAKANAVRDAVKAYFKQKGLHSTIGVEAIKVLVGPRV